MEVLQGTAYQDRLIDEVLDSFDALGGALPRHSSPRTPKDIHLRISLPDLGKVPGAEAAQQEAPGGSPRGPPDSIRQLARLESLGLGAAIAREREAMQYPLLHLWIGDTDVLRAALECMPQFVAPPPGRAWQLHYGSGDELIRPDDTCLSLGLESETLLLAKLVDKAT